MDNNETVVITATELKQNLGKYLEQVEQLNDVVITKNGSKIARLTPYVNDIEQYFTVREKALDYVYGGKKVSYEEFLEISEKTTQRMELINGEIYLLSSPNIMHQEIIGRLHLIFHAYLQGKKCRVFLAPFDVHLHKHEFKTPDVVQPDLLLVCDLENNITEKGRYTGTPELVVEILSDSTRSKDMIDKLNSYMLSTVKEYWIVDPKKKVVILYSFDQHNIDSILVFEIGKVAQSQTFEGLTVDVTALFEPII